MEIVVVDYRLCAFSYGFHKKRPVTEVISNIARTLLAHKINPTKLIFAVDIGRSKRTAVYPAYKMHRKEREKKEAPAEQKRRQEFERQYKESIEWLKLFVTVIDIAGIEADDIGSIIANRFANTEHKVTLFSSDKDWASFLVAPNIRMMRLIDLDFITEKNCEEKYGVDPLGIFYQQVFAGSPKENVDGLINFGPKTFQKFYTETQDFEYLKVRIYDECVLTGYRKIVVPEGITYEEMLDLNYRLFKPVVFEDLTEKEQEEFLEKFSTKRGNSYDNLSMTLLMDYGFSLPLSKDECDFYKLT